MSTATLDRTAAIRFHLGLPSGLQRLLQRAIAVPAAPAARQLDKGANAWIARPLGRIITCESGTLWLTFDNEPLDLILEAGESHHCVKHSKLLIHALAAARMSVD